MSNIEKKRTILREVLAPVLSEQELNAALDIWSRDFSSQPVLVPSFFLSSISQSLDITSRKDKILNILTRNVLPINLMGTAVNEVEEQPQRFEKKQKQIDEGLGSEKVVFSTLLQNIMTGFAHQNLCLKDLRKYLLVNLRDLRLPRGTKDTLQSFSGSIETNGSCSPINSSLKVADMSGFIDLIYSWSCDAIGPIITDKLFAEAIQKTELLPEARDFPPKKLF